VYSLVYYSCVIIYKCVLLYTVTVIPLMV